MPEPFDALALSQQARAAVQSGNWRAVQSCATALVQKDPANPEGHFLAGLVARAASQPEAAASAFERALTADPGRYDAAVELAEAWRMLGRPAKALRLLDAQVGRLGNSPKYLDLAGTVYSQLGLHARAAPLFEAACRLQPGVERLQASLAECLVTLGRLGEAETLYRELLGRFPRHQRYHYQLANLRRARDDEHLEQMRSALEASGGPPARNIFLYYAIGKELEDLERWDEAFEHYRKGGDAAKGVSGYRVEPDLALIDAIIATCDRAWLGAAVLEPVAASGPVTPAIGPRESTPVFITGLPRTGTTLAERILASHSQVESAGESFYLPLALHQLAGRQLEMVPKPATIMAAARRPGGELAERYLAAVSGRLEGKALFIEKLPENFLYLGFIARAFPDARLVYLRRHPMDACFALYKQSYFRFAYTLDDLARYYLAHDRLLRHWREVLGERLVELGYEDLVSDPEPQVRRWFGRLGLEFEPACLEFDRRGGAVATASAAQVREPIHTRSVGRWRKFERQLQPLRERLEAGGILVRADTH